MPIVLLIGVILLLLALILFLRSFLILQNGTSAEGTVIGLVEDSEDHIFAPIVRFSAGGEIVEFQHSIYENPPYKIGDRLKVIYYPNEPHKARVKSFTSLYMLPAIFGFSAAIILIVGLSVGNLEESRSDTPNDSPRRQIVGTPRRTL